MYKAHIVSSITKRNPHIWRLSILIHILPNEKQHIDVFSAQSKSFDRRMSLLCMERWCRSLAAHQHSVHLLCLSLHNYTSWSCFLSPPDHLFPRCQSSECASFCLHSLDIPSLPSPSLCWYHILPLLSVYCQHCLSHSPLCCLMELQKRGLEKYGTTKVCSQISGTEHQLFVD